MNISSLEMLQKNSGVNESSTTCQGIMFNLNNIVLKENNEKCTFASSKICRILL